MHVSCKKLRKIASVGDQEDSVYTAAINQHIKKIYADSEFESDSTIKKYLIVQTVGTGKKRKEIIMKYVVDSFGESVKTVAGKSG